jgi:hypothetical protein
MVAHQRAASRRIWLRGWGWGPRRRQRGGANPIWHTVKGIAAALGVPVSQLAKAAEGLEG